MYVVEFVWDEGGTTAVADVIDCVTGVEEHVVGTTDLDFEVVSVDDAEKVGKGIHCVFDDEEETLDDIDVEDVQ